MCFFLSNPYDKSGVVKVGRVDCTYDPAACKALNMSTSSSTTSLHYYPHSPVLGGATALLSHTAQEVAGEVLSLLPEMPAITEQQFKERLGAIQQQRGENQEQSTSAAVSMPAPVIEGTIKCYITAALGKQLLLQ